MNENNNNQETKQLNETKKMLIVLFILLCVFVLALLFWFNKRLIEREEATNNFVTCLEKDYETEDFEWNNISEEMLDTTNMLRISVTHAEIEHCQELYLD